MALAKNRANKIIGVWPYYFQKRYGFCLLRMPILCPYLGPQYFYPHNLKKTSRKIAFEKKLAFALHNQLPKYDFLNQHCSPDFTNAQALYWKGVIAKTQYTYQVDLQKTEKEIFDSLETSARTNIRKAEQANLALNLIRDLNLFYEINKKTYSHHKNKIPYDISLLKKLDGFLQSKNSGKIYAVVDQNGQTHAVCYLLSDKAKLYTLMIASDPSLRSSGAVDFLIWNIIKKEKPNYNTLDFCGTMIERIEPVFRALGAEQIPYLVLHHKRSKLFQLLDIFRKKY